jgi:4'-phosphopantetheinyl transferase
MNMLGSLKDNDAHVWRVLLDDAKWDDYTAVLNNAEREKAARYRTTTLQQHYRRCRSALRVILARYINVAAADLNFHLAEHGKPELPGHRIGFNVSHSGDYALVALAKHELGVDLEIAGKERSDLQGLIDMVCHPNEQTVLAQLPDADKAAQFYRLWTQKEAYCKMLGLGLYQSLPALYFKPAVGNHIWQAYADDHVPPAPSFLYQLDAPAGYAASLCVPLAAAQITYFAA